MSTKLIVPRESHGAGNRGFASHWGEIPAPTGIETETDQSPSGDEDGNGVQFSPRLLPRFGRYFYLHPRFFFFKL